MLNSNAKDTMIQNLNGPKRGLLNIELKNVHYEKMQSTDGKHLKVTRLLGLFLFDWKLQLLSQCKNGSSALGGLPDCFQNYFSLELSEEV